jgi:hypothetical protein
VGSPQWRTLAGVHSRVPWIGSHGRPRKFPHRASLSRTQDLARGGPHMWVTWKGFLDYGPVEGFPGGPMEGSLGREP